MLFRSSDVRREAYSIGDTPNPEPQYPATIMASAQIAGHTVNWSRSLNSAKGRTDRVNAREFMDIAKGHQKQVSDGEAVTLPVLGYYGTGRLWNQRKGYKSSSPGSRTSGYRACLETAADAHMLLRWFKRMELSALQEERVPTHLEAVRRAVREAIPGCVRFHFSAREDLPIVTMEGGGQIPFTALSDGLRNMVAMVADIAHRAARLNPHLEADAAIKSPGVILIDEVDLHLHPKWQRQVVADLMEAFPCMQFVATTHSPFIVQSLEPGMLISLDDPEQYDIDSPPPPEGMAAPPPKGEYSDKSIEDVTESAMGVDLPQRSERLVKMYEAAKEYYSVLHGAHRVADSDRRAIEARLDELASPYSANIAYHAFLEMERVAAGLGRSRPEGGPDEAR
mgnify:FL=1